MSDKKAAFAVSLLMLICAVAVLTGGTARAWSVPTEPVTESASMACTGEIGAEAGVAPHSQSRIRALGAFVLIFMALVVLVGGFKGVKTVFTLIVTAAGIFGFLLPALLAGHDPVVTSVVVCSAVALVALLVTGGLSVKTLAAVIGTTGGVMIAGLMASIAGQAVQISPMEVEEMQVLAHLPGAVELNHQGILFAGMIIGALGAVMDVGMSISSAMFEIKRANPTQGFGQLFRAGLNVGRDIMSTMANTLILAYTGSAIPLLLMLMAHDIPVQRIVSTEAITAEVVRITAGSIGLVMCIPVTAVAAGMLMAARR